MGKIPVALQLHSIREDCSRDLLGTLKAVADMGYDGVEFAGYHGRTAEQLRRMIDDVGLRVAGSHIPLNTLLGEDLKKTVEFNKMLGNQFLIVPWVLEDMRKSKADWLKTAMLFNEIAGKLKTEGLRVGYHNHHIEFVRVGGEFPWDIFFGAASHDVIMQLDTGNAMCGEATADDVLAVIERFPMRAVTVHLKEYSATNEEALIGEGEMKWKQFFELCEAVGGTKWYVVEQETCPYPPLDCARRCIGNLKTMM